MTFNVFNCFGGGGGGVYRPSAAVFDNVSYGTASSFTGQVNSKLLTASMWFYMNTSLDQANSIISLKDGSNSQSIAPAPDGNPANPNPVNVRFQGAALANALEFTANSFTGFAWQHIMFSVDLSDTGKRHVYLNDANPSTLTWTQYNNIEMEFTPSDGWYIGATFAGTNTFDGYIAELWFAPNVYLDLSIEANRRKFITDTGKPVNLSANGGAVTGTSPLIYCSGNGSQFSNNNGSGGGSFSITGALSDYSGVVELP